MDTDDRLRETSAALEELDPNWIDLETLGLWLDTCDTNHGDQCSRPFKHTGSDKTRPQWLVDIRRRCLKPAHPDDEYAALSYVWGGAATTQTTTSNVARLTQDAALLDPDIQLPRTIRDTMDLLEKLYIKYLWIDALCIVQDDETQKRNQIHAMAWIYANAYVTIVVADGDNADHGLRGIAGVTGPRTLSRSVVYDVDKSLRNRPPKWYTRGWTFQELTFSRRCIMFYMGLVLWECPRALWNETYLNSVFKIPRWPVQAQMPICADIRQYLNAVRSYNTRSFTFPQDALNAISSLLSVWCRAFDGGFITGLPQMFFHEAMLWQPEEPLTRRISTEVPDEDFPLPSWSWIGWEGPIDINSWAAHFTHLQLEPPGGYGDFLVTPTVDWFYMTSQGMIPVNASSLIYRDIAGNNALPERWEAVHGRKGYVYRVSGTKEAVTSHPLPLPLEAGALTCSTLLYTETRRGFFHPDRSEQPPRRSWCDEFYLLDSHGQRMGVLRLSSRSGPSGKITNQQESDAFELVELSEGVLQDYRMVTSWGEFGVEFGTTSAHKARITYVLCIEWVEGIAQRKGLGRVLTESWRRDATEEIDLLLG